MNLVRRCAEPFFHQAFFPFFPVSPVFPVVLLLNRYLTYSVFPFGWSIFWS